MSRSLLLAPRLLLLPTRGPMTLLMLVVLLAFLVLTGPAGAQSFMVQCPASTLLHPSAPTSAQGEPAYTGPKSQATMFYGPLTTVNPVTARGATGYNTPLGSYSVNAGPAGAEGAIPW